ncbi:Ger(x)C family spore germination protein [Paenibacillus hamazuiensis]|uniref:Ger(x)C family spore germination protein n=1 Tax=Paenibacillus hamazuiensis TaxID=2936508 RepID=UPI00200DC18B|nr:Ger(x)C family spore germination protein [Paenibacillus hamazuiensis]
MLRNLGLSIMLILLLLTATGCWSRMELNDIAIVVALGIDKKDGQYSVSVQLVNPSEVSGKKTGGGKGAPVVTHVASDATMFEAIRKMTTNAPRRLYFSHLRMLILSEQVAKEGVAKALDLLSRDHEFRSDFYIAVAKGAPAERILEIYTAPMETIPANKMYKALDTSSKIWAYSGKVTLDELISDMLRVGRQPVLTGIEIVGQRNGAARSQQNMERIKPYSVLQFSNLAVYLIKISWPDG